MREYKVGQIIPYDDVKLKVVEEITCRGCYFDHGHVCTAPDGEEFNCTESKRKDGNSVIFKLMKGGVKK